MGQITSLLPAIGQGEPMVLGELYALLYLDLRRIDNLTLLDTTSWVHESYLRLEKSGALVMGDRAQFMAYAARVMQSLVVDALRSQKT